MNISADGGHVAAVFKVLRICGSVIADVVSSSTAQKGVLDARAVRSMEIDKASVNAFFLDKIQGET